MQTYSDFLRDFEANMQFEDASIDKAVDYFNRDNDGKPYRVLRRPNETNYRALKFDAEIGNGDNTFKLEVKTDHKSVATGNFFIEYAAHRKPSGIAITDADYYIINDTVDYHMISVTRLLRIIKRYDELGKLRRVEFKNSDGLVTKGYIIKKAVALKFATKL